MHNQMQKFLDEIFFPTLAREGITNIIHLGDLVDRRLDADLAEAFLDQHRGRLVDGGEA